MEYKDPGGYIPIIYLLYSWGSRLGVPSRIPLYEGDMWECGGIYMGVDRDCIGFGFRT